GARAAEAPPWRGGEGVVAADRGRDDEGGGAGVANVPGEALGRFPPHFEPPAGEARGAGLDPLGGAHVAGCAEAVDEQPLLVVEAARVREPPRGPKPDGQREPLRSEEHTSELQSRENLVCRLL